MKLLHLLIMITLVAQPVCAKIYKWVDENGTTHFSDRPISEEAREVDIKGTGIELHEQVDTPATTAPPQQKPAETTKQQVKKKSAPEKKKVISENDYKITASVGKLGADIISISGRIGAGPKCDDMTVTAVASSDTDLSATVVDNIRKPNSFGSVVFEGNAKASGSTDDYGFWSISSIKVVCNDQ